MNDEFIDPASASGAYKAGYEELAQLHEWARRNPPSYYNVIVADRLRARIADEARPYHHAAWRRISVWARSLPEVSGEVRAAWNDEIAEKAILYGRKKRVLTGSDKPTSGKRGHVDNLEKPISPEEWYSHGFGVETPYVPKLKYNRIADPDYLRTEIEKRWGDRELPSFKPGPRSPFQQQMMDELADILADIQEGAGKRIHPKALVTVVACGERTAEKLINEGVMRIKPKAKPMPRPVPLPTTMMDSTTKTLRPVEEIHRGGHRYRHYGSATWNPTRVAYLLKQPATRLGMRVSKEL